MSIHRECPESPSASYIVLDLSLKKKPILIQNLIKIFTKTYQIALFFNSRRVACPLACVQLISLFLYERKIIFSFRMQSKYTLKRINCDMFKKKFREL